MFYTGFGVRIQGSEDSASRLHVMCILIGIIQQALALGWGLRVAGFKV